DKRAATAQQEKDLDIGTATNVLLQQVDIEIPLEIHTDRNDEEPTTVRSSGETSSMAHVTTEILSVNREHDGACNESENAGMPAINTSPALPDQNPGEFQVVQPRRRRKSTRSKINPEHHQDRPRTRVPR
ncbi:hypothetical protein Dimus_030105, partial [Dionaea muscipula]